MEMSELPCEEECESQVVINFRRIPPLMRPAPFWSAPAVHDAKIVNLTIRDFSGKYLVMVFYPYDFTIVCPTELIQFSDRAEEFQDLDAEIVAISTDSQYTHLAWVTTPRKQGGIGGMNIPILSDRSQRISKRYGVLDEDLGVSSKAVFIIDKQQNIRHMSITDMALPRSVDEALRVIQACQFVDKYGTICPMRSKNFEAGEIDPDFDEIKKE
ncbi:peroxiredoxin-2-like [Diachasma alloeum]|uniref:peroxiredoxin-2-like n=1 Tax=Diachasma alloeum TaxID=454923 RepID=UPI0007381CD8|nr:peroxiredoxin-2-like [Diachasma alloeum]